MLKITTIVILALIASVLLFAATRPDSFRVERSMRIKAPPEKIFALIDDLHAMQSWSPWEKVDPAMKRAHSGTPSGEGAVYEWEGNQDIGRGRMEIVRSSPPSKLKLKMDFLAPFEAHNIVEFSLEANGEVTTVTQAMYGPSPYLSKLIGLFVSMDGMVGGKFEEGLVALKTLSES